MRRARHHTILCAAVGMAVVAPGLAGAPAGPRADLVEGRLGAPPSRLPASRSFTVVESLANRGPGGAPRSTSRYYLRGASRVVAIGIRRVPRVGPHGALVRRVRLHVRLGVPAGSYRLVGCADSTRRVRERSERNNCRTARGRIAVPGVGATGPGTSPPAGSVSSVDTDHDGVPDGLDCAPADQAIHPGADDAPDLALTDSNCDGIDGDPTHAVFVSPQGKNGAAGTIDAPLRSLADAVTLADARNRDVYVAVGSYPEELRFASRVGIYGGYGASWRRSLTGVSQIVGTTTASGDTEAALALNITGATVAQLISLAPRAPSVPGAGGYGLRGVRSPGLRLDQ